jgi:hypothetical protein
MIHLGENEERNRTVVGVEVRTAASTAEPWVRLYGVIDGGFEVMRAAWPKLEHVFSVRRNDEEGPGEKSPEPKRLLKEHHRLPNDLLTRFPVDLFTIEQGFATLPPRVL